MADNQWFTAFSLVAKAARAKGYRPLFTGFSGAPVRWSGIFANTVHNTVLCGMKEKKPKTAKIPTKAEWEDELRRLLRAGGLYSATLDPMIETTARTLVMRDKLFACVESTDPLLEETDSRGNTKMKGNPAYSEYQRTSKEVRDQLKSLGMTITTLAAPEDDVDGLYKAVTDTRY